MSPTSPSNIFPGNVSIVAHSWQGSVCALIIFQLTCIQMFMKLIHIKYRRFCSFDQICRIYLKIFITLFIYYYYMYCRFLADYESMFSFHGDIEVLLQASSGVYLFKHNIVYHILNLMGRPISLHNGLLFNSIALRIFLSAIGL